MDKVDYYSEDIPGPIDEFEVLEALPSKIQTVYYNSSIDEKNDPRIIEDKIERESMKFQDIFENKLTKNFLESKKNKPKDKWLQFTMLRNELNLLKTELENEKNEEDDNIIKKVDELVDEMKEFSENRSEFIDYWKLKLNDSNLKGNMLENQVDTKDKNIDYVDNKLLLELESRIYSIETKIGPTDSISSLQNITDDLYRRTNLILDSEHSLEEVKLEILKMIDNCEKLIKNSRRIKYKSDIVPLTDKKLNFLYAKLLSMPQFEQLIPLVIDRLKTINDVISQTSDTVKFIDGLELEFSRMEGQIQLWNNKLNMLEKQIQQNEENFENSKAKIEQLISK